MTNTASPLDLLITGGTVMDGLGGVPYVADIGIVDGRIVAIGTDLAVNVGRAARTIDADGALVTPGFVDIHTHYDGQATWDERLNPSSGHGVTTVVMGNCGVGFAPVRAGDTDRLIELMEGVEDIPGTALREGLRWNWESIPEFLDVLAAARCDIDFAAQVTHAPLRLYVMGERGAQREAATLDEVAEMGRLAAEGVRAGALGFTTSRTLNHRTSRGEPTPTLTAARNELVGIAEAIGRTGTGVLQVVSDMIDVDDEMETFRRMMAASGRPLSLSVAQDARRPDGYRRILAAITEANEVGFEMRAQVAPRAVGVLLGLQGSVNPLARCPSFKAVSHLVLSEQARALSAIAGVVASEFEALDRTRMLSPDNIFPLAGSPDYEPAPHDSIAARAAALGVSAADVMVDHLLADEGRALLYAPILNYARGSLDDVSEMLQHPYTVPGLSDGGAHVGTICDGSFPTTLLAHWGVRRTRGPLLALEWLVKRQTHDTAVAVGLLDRGVLAVGYKADLNIIDIDRLGMSRPEMVFDLPAGGKRLLQPATGYRHTIVSGAEISHDGVETGERPGRLVRGARSDPALRLDRSASNPSAAP